MINVVYRHSYNSDQHINQIGKPEVAGVVIGG